MTLNKLRRQIEVHTAQRRDIGAEQAASDSATPEDALSREPSAEDICVAAELLARCLEELSPAKRQALLLRLEDRSTAEIAGEIGRTERTVRRWLHEIGERWLLLARSSDS